MKMTLISKIEKHTLLDYDTDLVLSFVFFLNLIFIIVDYLDIPLLHGWVLDPQDKITASVVQNQSYNQVINILVEYRSLLDRTVVSCKSSKLSKEENTQIEIGTEIKSTKSFLTEEEPTIRDEEHSAVSEKSGENDFGSLQNLEKNEINPNVCHDKDQTDESSYELIDSASESVEAPVFEIGSSVLDRDQLMNSKEKYTEVQICETPVTSEIVMKPNSTEVIEEMEGGISTGTTQEIIAEKPNVEDLKHDLSEGDLKLLREGEIIESFLSLTASQLTYLGLLSLHQRIRERQLAVFFRNNHFSTMFRFEGQLYLLVTDLGYQHEPSVVWELLDEIDG